MVGTFNKIIEIGIHWKQYGKGLTSALKQDMEGFRHGAKAVKTWGNNVNNATAKGYRFGNNIRMLTHGMRGFRMEMLGIMFFGMSITRLFQGLLKPSMDLVGVFDIWNTTLGVLFLPTALMLLDKVFLPMMDFFLNLPEPMQQVIGVFALFGLGMGKLLETVGMLALGVGSLIQAFGGSAVVGAIGSLGAVFAYVAAAIAVFLALWYSDIGGFRSFIVNSFKIIKEGVIEHIELLKDIAVAVWNAFLGLLEGDFDKYSENMVKAWIKFKDLLVNVILSLGAVFVNAGIWMMNTWKDIFIEKIPNFVLWGVKKMLGALSVIPFMEDKIRDAQDALDSWQESVSDFSSKFDLQYFTAEAVRGLIDKLSSPEEKKPNYTPNNYYEGMSSGLMTPNFIASPVNYMVIENKADDEIRMESRLYP